MNGEAIVALIVGAFGIITWLMGLSYFLGRNTAKLDGVAAAQEKTSATVNKIFEKLDILTIGVQHKCEQTPTITALQVLTAELQTTSREHGLRMDRIQESIRDKEQIALGRHATGEINLT